MWSGVVERNGGAEYQKIGGAERSGVGAVRLEVTLRQQLCD